MLPRHIGRLVVHQATRLVLHLGRLVLGLLTAVPKELLVKRRRLVDLDDVVLVKPIAVGLV